jgi:hypothetical protein
LGPTLLSCADIGNAAPVKSKVNQVAKMMSPAA